MTDDKTFQKVKELKLPKGKWALFAFVKLRSVMLFKKLNGREKDLKDIKLIEEYLENK